MRFVGFIGPSYNLRSVNADCQRCINLYPAIDEIGTGKEKEVAALVSTPGLTLLNTIGSGPIRGMYVTSLGDKFFVVSGTKLYSVSSLWAPTEVGTLLTSTGPVSFADNGVNLVVVDGDHGYAVVMSSLAFAQITDPAFPGAGQVTYQDGFFIFNQPATQQFFISAVNGVTFDALDIASAEGNPDNIVAIISDHRDLWLFGTQSVEVWYNSGNASFPFERNPGAFVEQGCAATYSVAKLNNTVFWLGRDNKGTGQVFMANGYQPQRISTHAVEQAIQSYATISDAVGYAYQEFGHHFYVLNFTSANTTWVFDTATSLWHERAYTNDGILERHRADCHVFAFGIHVVGDYQTGKIYQLSSDVYSDNGIPITRKRIAPHLTAGLKRVFYHSFELDIETGVGLDGSSQGIDPQVILQFSDDGGHTWSNEKWASFGKIGARKNRAIWRRLGQARDRVFSITITDPVKVTLLGAEIDLVQGAS